MPTQNVVLTEQQSRFVAELVATGRFQNASEALRAGLRMLEDVERERAEVRARVSESWAQVQRGELADGSGEQAIRRAFDEAMTLIEK